VLRVSGCKYKRFSEKGTLDFGFWTLDLLKNLLFRLLKAHFLFAASSKLLQ